MLYILANVLSTPPASRSWLSLIWALQTSGKPHQSPPRSSASLLAPPLRQEMKRALIPLDSRLADRIHSSGVEAVVVDLDSTLWNGNCESFSDFVQISESSVRRKRDERTLSLYPEVAATLQIMHELGVRVAVASASPAEGTALRLLRAFGILPFISKAVIQPGSKSTHLRLIRSSLGLSNFQRTLFVDDLEHNIRTVRAMGCTCVHVHGYCNPACGLPCTGHGMRSMDIINGLRDMQHSSKSAAIFRSFFKARSSSISGKVSSEEHKTSNSNRNVSTASSEACSRIQNTDLCAGAAMVGPLTEQETPHPERAMPI